MNDALPCRVTKKTTEVWKLTNINILHATDFVSIYCTYFEESVREEQETLIL